METLGQLTTSFVDTDSTAEEFGQDRGEVVVLLRMAVDVVEKVRAVRRFRGRKN
jgi:hypothetical protein